MGIIWVAAGIVGIWLSRNEQRSVVPAIVIALTAAAFQVSFEFEMITTVTTSNQANRLIGPCTTCCKQWSYPFFLWIHVDGRSFLKNH